MSKILCLAISIFMLSFVSSTFAVVSEQPVSQSDFQSLCTIEVECLEVRTPYGQPVTRFSDDSVYIDMGDIWWDSSLPPVWKVICTNGQQGIIHLYESFHVSGRVSFSDWDEQLYVKNCAGQWVPSDDYDWLYWNSAESTPMGTVTVDEPNDILTIEWDPELVPCTDVWIHKTINVPFGMTKFAVVEWPTVSGDVPEPSMILISGFLFLGMLLFKRK